MGPQLSTIFTLSWLDFSGIFNFSRPAANALLNPRQPTSALCQSDEIFVSGGPTPAQKIWSFQFFRVIFK